MSTRFRCLLAFLVLSLGLLPALAATPVSAATLSLSPGSTPGSSSGSPLVLELLGLGTLVGLVVKDAATAAAKYKSRASAAQGDYATGVQNGASHWEPNTLAAESHFEQGVTDAIARKAFGKGVRGSTAKYQKNATTLGPARFAAGVANAQDAYAAGMGPVISALSSITLPPKQVKGMNQDRTNIVMQRLRALKTGKAA